LDASFFTKNQEFVLKKTIVKLIFANISMKKATGDICNEELYSESDLGSHASKDH